MTERKQQIGVCLATFNGERYIAEQLDSVFSQSCQEFTLYIADDGSTDGTIEVIRTFQKRYPGRIALSINEKQLGALRNFEQLLHSCGEAYIAFCDQDDIWEPQKLRLQLDAIRELEREHPKTPCMVHSDLSMINGSGKPMHDSYFRFRGYRLLARKDLGHILGPSGVMGNTTMINAPLRKKALPFPAGLEVHDYWIGVVAELFGVRKTLREPLVRYRIHESNTSNSQVKVQSKGVLWQWFNRDLKLPYIDSSRHKVMETLLSQDISPTDKQTIEAFYDYLTFSKGRLGMFADLIRYSLVKRGAWFRTKLLFKIILTKRYRHAE